MESQVRSLGWKVALYISPSELVATRRMATVILGISVNQYSTLFTCSEILLATTCRKAMNIWIELLQSQNPTLLPSSRDDTKGKPAYIQVLRYLHFQQPDRSKSLDYTQSRSQSVSTASYPTTAWSDVNITPKHSLKRSRSF